MFDTTPLESLAEALERARDVAQAKAAQHATAEEHAPAGLQLSRAQRNETWSSTLRKAIAELKRAPRLRKAAGDGEETEAFLMFWAAYPGPRKSGKADARRAWHAMACEGQLTAILAALARNRKSFDWTKDGGQFIPAPATWLRREGWHDELLTPQEIRPADARRLPAPVADPARWTAFLKEHGFRATSYQTAPQHWKTEFATWEREAGF